MIRVPRTRRTARHPLQSLIIPAWTRGRPAAPFEPQQPAETERPIFRAHFNGASGGFL